MRFSIGMEALEYRFSVRKTRPTTSCRGKLGNGEQWGMAHSAIFCRRGKSHKMFSPSDVNSPMARVNIN